MVAVINIFCGCSNVKINYLKSGENLGQLDKPLSKVPTIKVKEWIHVVFQGVRTKDSWGAIYDVSITGDEVRQLNVRKGSYLNVNFQKMTVINEPFIYHRDPNDRLGAALERAGLKVVNESNKTQKADYTLVGEYEVGLAGWAATAGWITFDALMGIPSLFLPVPLGMSFKFSPTVSLFSPDGKKIGSRRIDTKGRLILFSAWSVIDANNANLDALADTAARITMELIRDQQVGSTQEVIPAELPHSFKFEGKRSP